MLYSTGPPRELESLGELVVVFAGCLAFCSSVATLAAGEIDYSTHLTLSPKEVKVGLPFDDHERQEV